ncbi:hypothetical protein NFI96_011596 [Prochilodus magdalenae]|nr:hypothetical protein NFI96_011596 [Prochilodus magdalenae]
MIGSVLGILYGVAQILVPCLPPTPLSSQGLLTNEKYLGKWYYMGVASWEKEDIATFEGVDNSVAVLHKGVNSSAVMTAAMHIEGQCKTLSWTYKIDPDSDPFMEEGEHIALAFDGKWVKCPTCLLLLKMGSESGLLRIMLFGQSPQAFSFNLEVFVQSYAKFEHPCTNDTFG